MGNHIDRRHFIAGSLALGSTAGAAAPAATGKYLSAARTYLDTMIEEGTDRYGKRHAPVFCLSLDPETHTPPRAPEKIDWEYARGFEYLYRDYGYYWKSHLHSSNLIYNQGDIRALYALTDSTRNPKYSRAADAYLRFFLENMVSQQTGVFGWGEHVFYNVFLDYIIGGAFGVRAWRHFSYNHELERWTTIYDLLWDKDQAKTLAEIDAIYEYKIHDPQTFIFNRHSDYYAGRNTADTLTFIKHSGLFVHAFSFAHVKTGEPRYLAWGKKMADLFWDIRDPRTNLVRGCVQRTNEPVAPAELAQLVLFLLRAYQWKPEQQYVDCATSFLAAYNKYFNAGGGRFREEVGTDGIDQKPGKFSEYWEAPIRFAKAAALAYSITGDPAALELADSVITRVTPETKIGTILQRSLISDELEARGYAISAAIDLYEATADRKYLAKAQELADDVIGRFFYRGLFVSRMQSTPEGDKAARTKVYDGRCAAGWVALNLIRLQKHSDATAAGTFRKLDKLDRIYD